MTDEDFKTDLLEILSRLTYNIAHMTASMDTIARAVERAEKEMAND